MNILVFCFMILMLLSVVTTAHLNLFVTRQISSTTVVQHPFYSKRVDQDNTTAKTNYYADFKCFEIGQGISFFKYWPSKLNLTCFTSKEEENHKKLFENLVFNLLPEEQEQQATKIINEIIEELKKSTARSEEGADFARKFSTLNHLANIVFDDPKEQEILFHLLHSPQRVNRSALSNFRKTPESPSLHDTVTLNKKFSEKTIYLHFAKKPLIKAIFEEQDWDGLLTAMESAEREVSTELKQIHKNELTKRNYLKEKEERDISNIVTLNESVIKKDLSLALVPTPLKIQSTQPTSPQSQKTPSSSQQPLKSSP